MQPWLCGFAKAAYPLCVSVSTCHKNGLGVESQPHVVTVLRLKKINIRKATARSQSVSGPVLVQQQGVG